MEIENQVAVCFSPPHCRSLEFNFSLGFQREKLSNGFRFLNTPEGLEKLDSICMKLIAIGESVKNLDKHTDSQLLTKYPSIDWKGVKGVRDIISHHYFDLDAEEIFNICDKHLPSLHTTIKQMIADLKK